MVKRIGDVIWDIYCGMGHDATSDEGKELRQSMTAVAVRSKYSRRSR